MAVTKRRLAALVTHPIQYFKPIFQGLAADPEVELLVVYGCDHGLEASADPDFGVTFAWDSHPIEGFPSSFASIVSNGVPTRMDDNEIGNSSAIRWFHPTMRA